MKYPKVLIEHQARSSVSKSALVKQYHIADILTPPPVTLISCEGATDVLVLDYVNKTQQEGGNYTANEEIWYTFLVNNYNEFNLSFKYGVENKHYIGDGAVEYLKGVVNADGTLAISVYSNVPVGKECRLRIDAYGSSPSPQYVIIDEVANPTAFYDTKNYRIAACLTYREIPVIPLTCVGATDWVKFSVKELNYDGSGSNLNHTELKYNVEVDGVDYGEFNMSYSGYIELGDVTMNISIGSEGSGHIYVSTANGTNVPMKFVFTPNSDMVDANFWGVDEETNPTAIYDKSNRSLRVCMTASANT